MKIGVLGGGQLGRMLALAGYPLGLRFRFFDPVPESPVQDLADLVVGRFDDLDILSRFPDGLDAITYEFENVPVEPARHLARRVPVYPPIEALEVSQDRLSEKTLFNALGMATAPFVALDTYDEYQQAVCSIGLPAVLKTRRLGYDGKGQVLLRSQADVAPAWQTLKGVPLILEGFVAFERELSQIAARGRDGAIVCYPLVENYHAGGILRRSIAPAPATSDDLTNTAQAFLRRLMEHLNYIGVLTVEFFQKDGRLIANEMAPRVHNSGHWTIEGARTSQFENHLRAVAGWPLGSADAVGHCVMVNLIGTLPPTPDVLALSEAHLHLYGKAERPGRKVGHITLWGESPGPLLEASRGLLSSVD
ncbi:MAG: 5-(carboxyamino)imidazole ribonucleotide synthase [Planctomycetia bacterium]|nr:5-(carboxyamino)imidazole ribonucleotide synthase [Planctomycetia bacterium]